MIDDFQTCPGCRGTGTVAGCSYTWCNMCDKTGKVAVKRPISKVEEFKSEWNSKYGFPPTDSDIFNAGMLRERNAVPTKPVASTLTDAELTALIRRVEDKLGIVWFVPDDSERYAWRTTNTNERLKYVRALLDAAPTQGADARRAYVRLTNSVGFDSEGNSRYLADSEIMEAFDRFFGQGADARPVAGLSAEAKWNIASRVQAQCERLGSCVTFRSAASQAINDTLEAINATRDAAPILGYRIDGADYTDDPLFTEEKAIADDYASKGFVITKLIAASAPKAVR
jgi:hypothetical protein